LNVVPVGIGRRQPTLSETYPSSTFRAGFDKIGEDTQAVMSDSDSAEESCNRKVLYISKKKLSKISNYFKYHLGFR
jgi:hypothetical protein